jgi:CyaY protein
MMDEARYLQVVDQTFRRIQDAFDDVDPDVVDAYMAGDVLTLAFRNGVKCVINTQRPVRQVWLAARANAWHFDYDEATGRWVDDKGRGEELFALVTRIVKENTGLDVKLG